MSIEKILEDLVVAVEDNTKALKDVLAARSEVVTAAAKLADKVAPGKRAAKDDDDEKPARGRGRAAAKDDDEEDEKPARGRGRAAAKDDDDEKPARGRGRPPKNAEPASKFTVDDLKAGYSKFLSVDDDDERADRAASVRKICKFLGISKIPEADEKDYDRVMGWLGDLKKGKDPVLTDDEDSDEGDDGLV